MVTRSDKLLALVREADARAALVHKPSNIRWLSGYTGEGLLLVGEGLRAIVTDFRYTEQAERQAPGFSVHMTSAAMPHEKLAAELFGGASKIAFEDDYVTVRDLTKLRAAMPDADFVPVNGKAELLRRVKDDDEIALIEKACQITCEAFEYILGFIKPGVTEFEIRVALENAMIRFGAEKPSFDTIIAAGANGSLPHAIPGAYAVKAGEMITMDFGAKYAGYCADFTRTVAVGALSDDKRRVYDTVLRAQLAAHDAIRVGVRGRDVDKVARDIIDASGYQGRFGHGLGHSLGLDIHEDPRCSATCDVALEAGMLMTNEPGIYLPGNCGCRIEDTVLVTDNGARRLTTAGRELITL